ncbi:MAG: SPOR domain-containing protein, partial [Geopsychrobacter sp.]|nr:SPOR domain-containing protein [Geopsychrobacter sp.]
MNSRRLLLLIWPLILLLCSCVGNPRQAVTPPTTKDPIAQLLEDAPTLPKMGFSVQVGAFSKLGNAVRLEQRLEARGIDAYYFRHSSGLF